MDVIGALQMCDAPSDAFSAGLWCEAANVLAAALEAEQAAHARTREALRKLLASYLQRANPWEPSVDLAKDALAKENA